MVDILETKDISDAHIHIRIKVYIRPDLTPNERVLRNKLSGEIKQRILKSLGSDGISWVDRSSGAGRALHVLDSEFYLNSSDKHFSISEKSNDPMEIQLTVYTTMFQSSKIEEGVP